MAARSFHGYSHIFPVRGPPLEWREQYEIKVNIVLIHSQYLRVMKYTPKFQCVTIALLTLT